VKCHLKLHIDITLHYITDIIDHVNALSMELTSDIGLVVTLFVLVSNAFLLFCP